MLRTTLAHFDEHPDAWSAKQPVATAVGALRDHLATFERHAEVQADSDTEGLTEEKTDARTHAAGLLADLGRKVSAYALTTGDADLRRAVDRTAREWLRMREADFVSESASALTRTEAVLADLGPYEVTPDDVTDARAAVARVPTLADDRDNVGIDHADATADLDRAYSEAVPTLDRLVPSLVDDEDFRDQYALARRIPGE